jgi:transposase
MITLRINDNELLDIAEAQDDPEVSERAKIKLLAVTMHDEGIPHRAIGRILHITSPTLVSYLKTYRDGGLQALLEERSYKPSSSLEAFWQCLVCSFKAAPVSSAKEAVKRITSLTGITLSESQARRTMKKMGMSLKKAASIPAKADPQLQLDFYTTELKPRLQEASRGERKVYFVDAAHFVLGSFLGMIWCFARPLIRTSPGRQRYSVLGAIDSQTKELVSVRTRENVNFWTICELLFEIANRNPDCQVTLVMDNARYQRNKFVMQAAAEYGIEILFLPPYSPNLNLIERLWKLTKKKCLNNRYYENFEKFVQGIDDCLDSLGNTLKDDVASLLTLNFQFFQNRKS